MPPLSEISQGTAAVSQTSDVRAAPVEGPEASLVADRDRAAVDLDVGGAALELGAVELGQRRVDADVHLGRAPGELEAADGDAAQRRRERTGLRAALVGAAGVTVGRRTGHRAHLSLVELADAAHVVADDPDVVGVESLELRPAGQLDLAVDARAQLTRRGRRGDQHAAAVGGVGDAVRRSRSAPCGRARS